MASQRIKGITIEIGGDTTQLTNALSSVDKAVKATQANLRDINKALKYDTGNVSLLKLKQDNLNDSVTEAKQKLDAEKKALDQLRNSDGFDKNSKAAKDLETQIALDEVELKKAQDALKSFGSVGKQQFEIVSAKIKETGETVSKIGEGLTRTITAPIVGIGAASVAAWGEVDSAMDIVITKTGATGQALEELQAGVTNIAESIPTSFETAGTAIGEVNTRFGLTGQALEDLSKQFIEFAELNNTDVNSSIDQTQKTLAAFGLEASDAGALLDTFNKVGQDTGISMDSLASLMTSNATAFRSMGLDAADAAVLLGKLEKSGIDTSVAITGLTKVQKEAAEEGISMQDALSSALTDVNSAIDVFGAKAGVKLYESFQNGALSVADFVDSTASLNDALGSVGETYEATLDPMDQMTTTMNTLKQTGADIVNSAAPMLQKAMQAIADVVKRLSEAWRGLTPAQQETIIKMATVAAAVGPIIAIVGKVIIGIGSLVSAVGTITSAISAAIPIISGIATLITGTVIPAIAAVVAPILPIIAAIAAVIAIIVLCVKHWDEIKEAAGRAVEYMSEAWNNFKDNMAAVWDSIKRGVTDGVNQMVEKWQSFKDNVTRHWQDLKNNITNAVTGIWNAVTGKFNEIKNNVINRVLELKNNAINAFSNLRQSIANTVGGISSVIVSGFQNAISFITSLPSRALGWGRDIINGIVDGIRSAISRITSVMSDVANTIASFIHFSEPDKGPLSNFHTYMPDMMKQMAQGIQNGIPMLENAMNTMAQSMIPSMGSMSASGMAAGTTNNNTSNSVSINVYGSAGQDVNELANIIEQKITDNVVRRGVAFT